MTSSLANFTDVLNDVVEDSQPLSFASDDCIHDRIRVGNNSGSEESFPISNIIKPRKGTGQHGQYRSVEEIDPKYRGVFTYPLFNLVQSKVIEDALYSDKSMVICAPTGSGKTVVFEMAIVQLLMEMEDSKDVKDYKIIYMAPVKALCTERLTEWSPKFTRLGLLCIEVTGDTDVDFSQLKPYRIIITTPEKWDMLTRRWRDHRGLVNMIKLFLIDEVHILNDITRGPVLEAVVSRMKTIESAAQSAHRIEQLQSEYQGTEFTDIPAPPKIRFVAASATVNNPEDVANWLGNPERPAVFYKFGEECRPVKLKKIVEGYPCPDGMSIFKFDIVLNYKISPIIRKYHNGKPTLIFCNTRKSVLFTAETLSKELTINFEPQQKAKLAALASSIKNKKLQTLLLNGIGCHHAGLLFEERTKIENAFRNRDLPILITTTTLAMGVNLPAHLVIIKNTQQYVNGAYQEYSISTILQMVGRAGRPQFDTEATAVIMTTLKDKPRYQALVEGSEPLQSYLHTRLAENLNCEAALGTIDDVAQCVQWLRSTFLYVRAGRDPKRYLGLPPAAPHELISKKIEELCVRAMNGLASSGMITMDETCSIQSTAAGRLMSSYYLDLGTMKNIMKITGSETLEELLLILCECHELADMHLRMDERRLLNTLNRNNNAATIRFPMKGKITTRQMKVNCIIQAVLGCLPIPDPSLNQEAMKIMRIADRICKCLVAYVTHPELTSGQSKSFSTVLNSLILAKCVSAQLWENSPYVSKQLKGIGPTFSNLLATAGKVNFMLLEESHPRDLERIINKGPPMGNVLHKLFTLLPKYQLSTTPIDQNLVAVQLLLLNQAYLSENLDELTAGDAHKCYIVIGDSENFLHHLSSFRDKDLISIYDGSITYQITRKHNFEHKMFVHCISASFVGIDAKCEYLFRSLEPQTLHTDISTSVSNTNKKVAKKQTTILDTFKERKRKSNDDISQTKEKKKRNTTIMKKFQNLKDSFSVSSKQLNDELYKTTEMSNEIIDTYMETNPNISTLYNNQQSLENIAQDTATESILLDNDLDTVELSDDNLYDINNIESIMEEIENEISRSSNKNNEYKTDEIPSKTITSNNKNLKCNTDLYFKANPRDNLRKNINKFNKTNYNFIELLEKNIDLDSDNENSPTVKNSTGFSDAVRNKIENYLKTNFNNTNPADKLVEELIHEGETDLPGVCLEQSAKESKGDCHFTDNDSKEKILTPEINDSNDIKMQNVNNYSSEKMVTERSRDTILPYNRLDVITEKKLDVKNKEDEINEYQYDATNTDNLLIEDILEDYDSNIPGTKSIEQIQNPFSKNVLMLHNSNNTHAQNKELLSADSIRNLQLSNKEIADIAYENPISKGIIIPSKERNVSCPYTHKVDYLPSKSFYPVKSNSDNQTIKYTYSRTNINYTTKNMPDHIIRVKRKLQVDVIAEILPIQEAAREAKILKTNETANNEKYKIVTNLQNEERVIKCIDKKTTPSSSLEGKKCNVKNELYENINELREKEAAEDQKINRNNKENIINEDNNAEPSSVAQILQKHFNVFRMKSEPINRNQTSVKIHDGDKPALPSAVKQKRPFKINQIRDIHIPLPETLIENSGTPSQSIGEFKGIKLHERANQKQIIKPQNISSNIILPPTDITPVKVGNLSPEFKTPTKLDLETGDHVLDQSMFDPKILLQSMNVTADEDIIPPPHEFRDNFEPDTPHENFQSMYYNVDSLDHINNTCVNSKNIDPNIKEIENWTLSRNSSVWSLANNTITEPLNNNQWPCAMPQEITSTVKNLTLPCVPRRHKLAQFNFSQKEKLKK